MLGFTLTANVDCVLKRELIQLGELVEHDFNFDLVGAIASKVAKLKPLLRYLFVPNRLVWFVQLITLGKFNTELDALDYLLSLQGLILEFYKQGPNVVFVTQTVLFCLECVAVTVQKAQVHVLCWRVLYLLLRILNLVIVFTAKHTAQTFIKLPLHLCINFRARI